MEICKVEECTGCGACYIVCPVKAIKLVKHAKGWLIPNVDSELCVKCNKCKDVCHINSYKIKFERQYGCYAVCAKNNIMRLEASSGGIVSILAQYVFLLGGAVVGAVFDQDQHLYEDIAFSWEEYCRKGFSRSKYVQSETRDCFTRIKEYLEQNRLPLLFVGTPCQNAALSTFLGKSYSNLIKLDFVCHGVPSPEVFRSYCKYLEKRYNSPIKQIKFRVKRPSWSLSSTVYMFENGKKYIGNMMDDPYNACFVNNNSLRESCYNCKYCRMERTSDMTVCDYWGKREVQLSQQDEQLGVSAVIINSDIGNKYFSEIKELIISKEISYASILAGNARLQDAHCDHSNSEEFWKAYLSGKSWDELNEFCVSYLDCVSKKTAFLMRYGTRQPIKFVRSIFRIMRKGIRK